LAEVQANAKEDVKKKDKEIEKIKKLSQEEGKEMKKKYGILLNVVNDTILS
jgi:hypothetical protein